MFKNELKQYVADSGLVNQKPAGDGIYILKYKKKVFYKNLWNRYIAECRGTIVNEDFDIISYPFTKIYNFGIEKQAPKLDDGVMVNAYRKINGFMVSVTWYDGDILVSTTGSTVSDYVQYAKEKINRDKFRSVCEQNPDYTFMFECVHENDPHIIQEKTGMYLLGYRKKEWGSRIEADRLDYYGEQFGCFVPEFFRVSVGELKKMTKECHHEGFVAYTDTGTAFKIKSPFYLTSKWVSRNPRTDKLVDLNCDIKKSIDEEYHDLVDAIRLNISEYTEMSEQERLSWVRKQLDTTQNEI